jgi:outer membrane protein assembly factor BamB
VESLRPEDPRQIGAYHVLARLGSGGMGRVFLGVSPGGRQVAVKLVHATLADDQEFRVRFRREVMAARAVSGAFTAPVVDADVDAPRPWLVTAFLPGLSLAEVVAEHGRLPPPAACALAVGLAEGLAAIHGAGVVHRDLKPANVMLTSDGPRVIDFGVARAVEATAVTQTGVLVGSPGYIAPEQAEAGETGAAGDVFALGAVLTFATTGTGPFGGGDVPTLLHRVVHNEPRLEDVPDPRLREIIAACLKKDPARRPDPARLLDWLDADRGPSPHGTAWLPAPVAIAIARRTAAPLPIPEPIPEPIPARPATKIYPARRNPTRRTVLIGGIAAATAAGGTAAAYAVRGRNKAETSPVRWTFHGPGQRVNAGPTVVGDAVFLYGGTRLYAIDARTGRPRWHPDTVIEIAEPGSRLPYLTDVPFAVAAGIGYLLTIGAPSPAPGLRPGSRRLLAVDLATGRVLWRRDIDYAPDQPITPAVTAGVVCLPAARQDDADAGLYGFDARTGRPRWHYVAGSTAQPTLTAAAGVFYYAAFESQDLHAVDAASGRRRWQRPLSDYAAAAPLVVRDLVLVTSRVHTIKALDAATGKPRWEAAMGGDTKQYGPGPVVAGGNLYFGGRDGIVYAFDAATGKGRWTFDSGGKDGGYMSVVPGDGTVSFTRASRLYALDAATGQGRWQQTVRSGANEKPVLAGGLVHIADGGLASFDPESGRLIRKLTTDNNGGPMTAVDRVTAAGEGLYFRSGSGRIAAADAHD